MAESGSLKKARWQGIVGLVVAFAGLSFAIRALGSADLSSLVDPEKVWLLAILPFLAALSMGVVGAIWWVLVRMAGGTASIGDTLGAYYPGQLGKYLPGGFWPILGRGELLYRAGVRRTPAYMSVALSLVYTYAAAAVVGTPALLAVSFDAGASVQLVGASVVFSLLSLVLHPSVFGWVRSVGERLLRRPIGVEVPTWGLTVGVLAVSMVAWLGVGLTTGLVAAAYGLDVSPSATVSATALSWLAGFLFIPVPGGIGVREAVFIAAMPGLVEAEAALIALAARFVFVVGDLLAAAIVVGAAALRRET